LHIFRTSPPSPSTSTPTPSTPGAPLGGCGGVQRPHAGTAPTRAPPPRGHRPHLIMSLDYHSKLPNETDAEHKRRIIAYNKRIQEESKNKLIADKSRDLPYDETLLKKQIVDMTNEISGLCFDSSGTMTRSATDSEKQHFANVYGYLCETSQTIFEMILRGDTPDLKELKTLIYFQRLIREGTLTKYTASQAFSEYRIKKLLNKESTNNEKKCNVSKAFMDNSIYGFD
jgi:hypothetical protein